MTDGITIYTDGASRGNPGEAGAAFVLADKDNNQLQAKGFFIGKTTNNVAEYTAVIKALEAAKQTKAQHIQLFSDSEQLSADVVVDHRVEDVIGQGLVVIEKEIAAGARGLRVQYVD